MDHKIDGMETGATDAMSKPSSRNSSRQSGSERKPRLAISGFVNLFSLVLVNDIAGRHAPLLKLKVDTVTVSTGVSESYSKQKLQQTSIEQVTAYSSPSSPDASPVAISVCYSGTAGIELDFFRADAAHWEPLLEHWIPTIKITDGRADTDIDITSDRGLQLNITGAALSALAVTYSIVCIHGEEQQRRRDFCPLVVENHLGVDVKLADSKTGEDLIVLIGE